ncbi:MAG: diguanylate cyclase [Bacilli bacterium]
MNLFKRLFNPTVKTIYKVLFLVFLTILVTYLVFKTGGTKGAWAQLYFMTIILAAYYWRTVGGLFVAFVMGFIVGPFMPLDVSQGIMQTPENWMIRMLVFMIIGFFAGYILKNVDDINGQMKEKDLIHQSTGLYNTNKLFPILDELFERNEKICLIFFQIRNFEEISKYVHSSIMNNLIQQCILTIQSKYKGNELYSSNYNEFILALNGCNHCEINHSVCEELKDLLKSIQIGNYSFHLIIKVGIAYSDGRHLNSLDLVEKARIAASQGQNFESGVYIYDPAFDQKWRFYYEIAGSIQAAIDQNELYLVYQPIII